MVLQIPQAVALYFQDNFEFETQEAADVLKEETVPTVMNMFFKELSVQRIWMLLL